MSTWMHERARVASLSRSRTPDDPELIDARRTLKATRLEHYVREAVESFPPLTEAQLDCIAAVLRPTASAGGRR